MGCEVVALVVPGGRHAPLDWNSYCVHELAHNTLLFLFVCFFTNNCCFSIKVYHVLLCMSRNTGQINPAGFQSLNYMYYTHVIMTIKWFLTLTLTLSISCKLDNKNLFSNMDVRHGLLLNRCWSTDKFSLQFLKTLVLTHILRNGDMKKNVSKFLNEMQNIDWSTLLLINDAQCAYSTFHKMLPSIYNKCFPFRKYDKPYYKKKPWLTLALKEAIKIKNKLYVTSTKGRNKEEKSTQYE